MVTTQGSAGPELAIRSWTGRLGSVWVTSARRHNSSRGDLTAHGGQRGSTRRVSTVSAEAAGRVPLAGPRVAGRAQGDGAAPSTLPEPPAPAPRPPHARARPAFPIGPSGAAVRAPEAQAPPRPRGRAPVRPPARALALALARARRAAEPLKGGRRRGPGGDGEPGSPAVRAGSAAVRAREPRVIQTPEARPQEAHHR